MGGVPNFDHIRTVEWFKKTGPTTSGVKFRIRLEERKIAANTSEHTHPFFIQESAAPWWLGSRQAGHLKSFWAQLLPPFSIRFLDLLHSVLLLTAVIPSGVLNETVGPYRV